MKKINKAPASHRWNYLGAIVLFLFTFSVVQSQAQITNLVARNTSLQVNLTGPNAGLSDWTVNGVNQLNQQWFYYSVGGSPVYSIDNISAWSAPTIVIGNGNSPSLTETYANSTLSVSATFQLVSSPIGSPKAQLITTIGIVNESSSAETVNFYQYSDFDLGGAPGGQTVQFPGTIQPYNVTQTGNGGPLTGSISSVSGGTGDVVGEIAGLYNGSQFGLLNGNPAPTFNSTILSAGPGDATFGYEITATIAAGSSVTISELQAVPEPSSLALISCGILALAFFHRSRLVFLKK
jgi:hypothetical protein